MVIPEARTGATTSCAPCQRSRTPALRQYLGAGLAPFQGIRYGSDPRRAVRNRFLDMIYQLDLLFQVPIGGRKCSPPITLPDGRCALKKVCSTRGLFCTGRKLGHCRWPNQEQIKIVLPNEGRGFESVSRSNMHPLFFPSLLNSDGNPPPEPPRVRNCLSLTPFRIT